MLFGNYRASHVYSRFLLLFTGNRRYIQSLALQRALIWTSYGTRRVVPQLITVP
jgi:hypothetical protein